MLSPFWCQQSCGCVCSFLSNPVAVPVPPQQSLQSHGVLISSTEALASNWASHRGKVQSQQHFDFTLSPVGAGKALQNRAGCIQLFLTLCAQQRACPGVDF